SSLVPGVKAVTTLKVWLGPSRQLEFWSIVRNAFPGVDVMVAVVVIVAEASADAIGDASGVAGVLAVRPAVGRPCAPSVMATMVAAACCGLVDGGAFTPILQADMLKAN